MFAERQGVLLSVESVHTDYVGHALSIGMLFKGLASTANAISLA